VIAGTARSIRLDAPGTGTRPLSDRVKQTLFGILEPDLPGANFLDLYAGSGAGGIEALSRGAAHATFVEHHPGAVATIRRNLDRTGLAGSERASVVRADALMWLHEAEAGGEAYEIVLVDPPYDDTQALTGALAMLAPVLRPGARVVAKHFWRSPPPATVGLLASERERRFGDTALTFYRRVEDA
jgi:16S rRNA (guanine966-N2)-methyltransferase